MAEAIKAVFLGGPADGVELDYESRAVEFMEFSHGYATRCSPSIVRIWVGRLHVYEAVSVAALCLADMFKPWYPLPVEYRYVGAQELPAAKVAV